MAPTTQNANQVTRRLVLLFLFFSSLLAFGQQPAKEPASDASSTRTGDSGAIFQTGHSGPIQALAFTANGQWIASGGYDKSVLLWNASNGQQIARLSGHKAAIVGLSFSPDASQLASSSFDGSIRIWNVSTKSLIYAIHLSGSIRCLQYTADGNFWIVGADATKEVNTSRIELHDSSTGKLVQTISTDWFGITALAVTNDGRIIASGLLSDDDSSEGSVHIWDLATGQLRKTYPVRADAFSQDGHWMGTIDYSKSPKRAVISDLTTGLEKLSLPVANEQAIYFSPDGKQFGITDPMSSRLKLCSIASREVITLDSESSPGSTGLSAAAFSADSKSLIAAPYPDYSIKLWDIASASQKQVFYGQAIVQGMLVDGARNRLMAGSPHGLDFLDINTGERTGILPIGYVNYLSLSPDGRWLAINPGARFAGEKLMIWDLRSHRAAAEFSFAQGGTPIFFTAFIMNGSPLKELGPISRSFEFTSDDGKHTVWSSPSPVVSTPDGQRLIVQTGMAGTFVVWDMASGHKLATVEAHKISLKSIAFSPDGRSLMTVGQESQANSAQKSPEWGVKTWETSTWKPLISILFAAGGAPSASFSPDGHKIAIEKAWDRVEIIDAQNGASLEILTSKDPNSNSHQFAPNSVVFSPDGSRLFQGAQNGIRVWNLSRP